MSADEVLSEREKAVLDAASTNGRKDPTHESDTHTDALRSAIIHTRDRDDGQELRRELDELREQVKRDRELRKTFVAKLNRLEDAVENDPAVVGTTTLERLATMDEEDRQETLGPSHQRAVEIYEHWDELAWTAGERGSERLMETKAVANAKNNPAKIKYRLEKHFDRSFGWNEIYRAMQAVARLSGGQEETTEYGRTKIVGGDFVYEETITADGSDTRRVLKEATR